MLLLEASAAKLTGVHPDLVDVVLLAAKITTIDFIVTEGPRSIERQKLLVAQGKSRTMQSRHIRNPKTNLCYAVDLAVWFDRDADRVVDVNELSWRFPFYLELANTMKRAAKELKIPVEWGGDWKTFKDGPHFQLPLNKYPA
jgi:peptidoglycan L-alanyl-D-glutamate endopeptidase CwlK